MCRAHAHVYRKKPHVVGSKVGTRSFPVQLQLSMAAKKQRKFVTRVVKDRSVYIREYGLSYMEAGTCTVLLL